MLIDLSEILSLEGKTQVVKHLFPWIPFKADLGSFPVAEKRTSDCDYYQHRKEGSQDRSQRPYDHKDSL